jgi:hypothetical protein
MTHMYNTTVHASINDVSVTTGNADGWVVIARDPIAEPIPASLARRAGEPKPAPRKAKRPRKVRS